MGTLKIIAWIIIIVYVLIVVALYVLQTRLIFFPGVLPKDYRFRLSSGDEEVFLRTSDGERINALFFRSEGPDVILYFHGNAGDLSGWQDVAGDFTALGYNFMIIDYRGYGKSSGRLSEEGLYRDAQAAYDYLINKGYTSQQIVVYGRSVGCGIAVELASSRQCKGLVLESPFSSLAKLANQKLPLFFPSAYLRFRFDNVKKINHVRCPVIFLHGSHDSLIPPSHSQELYDRYQGRKEMIIVDRGSHNDLRTFRRYQHFLKNAMAAFFDGGRG